VSRATEHAQAAGEAFWPLSSRALAQVQQVRKLSALCRPSAATRLHMWALLGATLGLLGCTGCQALTVLAVGVLGSWHCLQHTGRALLLPSWPSRSDLIVMCVCSALCCAVYRSAFAEDKLELGEKELDSGNMREIRLRRLT
jgi:hypothetical protein